VDVPLSEWGVEEARQSGALMREAGLRPDVVHTSVLRRAVVTANLALEEMGLAWLPVHRSWRLNERHYGGLQGLNKRETAERYGEDQVKVWRRSYATPPPPLDEADMAEYREDPRYRLLPPESLPLTEALADVVARMMPYWEDRIVPDLVQGRTVLVAAHGNSLRALVKHLDGLSEEAVVALNIPTGIPLVYRLDDDLRPTSSEYVGDPETVAAKARAVANQAATGA
jgi:2,3-bisphosphoglycerate-dependent phosphoglycerate mutase